MVAYTISAAFLNHRPHRRSVQRWMKLNKEAIQAIQATVSRCFKSTQWNLETELNKQCSRPLRHYFKKWLDNTLQTNSSLVYMCHTSNISSYLSFIHLFLFFIFLPFFYSRLFGHWEISHCTCLLVIQCIFLPLFVWIRSNKGFFVLGAWVWLFQHGIATILMQRKHACHV